MNDIERLLKQEIPRKIIQGFEPTQNLRSSPPRPRSNNKGKGGLQRRGFKSSGKTKPSKGKAAWHKRRPEKDSANK